MDTGFILINKPKDWTSHDVVSYLRKITGIKKIGHAGTLDPFATGLLIVGIGREATKRLDEFKNMPKEYIATIKLGATTDTYDRTGKKTMKQFNNETIRLSKKQIRKILATFVGPQTQLPPMYSAKKVGGKKLYELARKGIEIERTPTKIEIFKLKLIKDIVFTSPFRGGRLRRSRSGWGNESKITLRIVCSSGTYIRTLSHDIGQTLGYGAYCEELERTKIGKYSIKKALEPKLLTKDNIFQNLFN